jgi:ChrB-like protein
VAVWRELRRIGAVSPQQAVWVLPDRAPARRALERVQELVANAGGEVVLLRGEALDDATAKRLQGLYVDAREEEYREFLVECDRFLKEIQREIAKGKLTSAELDEEEQSYERLARWHRDIVARTMFETASAPTAEKRLKDCETALGDYTEKVFREETG